MFIQDKLWIHHDPHLNKAVSENDFLTMLCTSNKSTLRMVCGIYFTHVYFIRILILSAIVIDPR